MKHSLLARPAFLLFCGLLGSSLTSLAQAQTEAPLFSADGYRLSLYRSPTPAQIDYGQTLDTAALQQLLREQPRTRLIDVYRRQWLQGLGLGFYDGAFGPGTGAFWTLSNIRLHRLSLLHATGMTKSMNFVSNICALSAFAWFGHVDLRIGLVMGGAIMIGALIGAHTAIRFGATFIRPFFMLTVLAMSLYLGWRAW